MSEPVSSLAASPGNTNAGDTALTPVTVDQSQNVLTKEATDLKASVTAKCLESLLDLCAKDDKDAFATQLDKLRVTGNLEAFMEHQVALPFRMDALLNDRSYRRGIKDLTETVADKEKVELLLDHIVGHLITELKRNFKAYYYARLLQLDTLLNDAIQSYVHGALVTNYAVYFGKFESEIRDILRPLRQKINELRQQQSEFIKERDGLQQLRVWRAEVALLQTQLKSSEAEKTAAVAAAVAKAETEWKAQKTAPVAEAETKWKAEETAAVPSKHHRTASCSNDWKETDRDAKHPHCNCQGKFESLGTRGSGR